MAGSKKQKLPPIAQGWLEDAERRRRPAKTVVDKMGDKGPFGMCFQLPKDWDDGSGKVRHIKSGIHKGRVAFTSRREAQEIAKRWADKAGRSVEYDP